MRGESDADVPVVEVPTPDARLLEVVLPYCLNDQAFHLPHDVVGDAVDYGRPLPLPGLPVPDVPAAALALHVDVRVLHECSGASLVEFRFNGSS